MNEEQIKVMNGVIGELNEALDSLNISSPGFEDVVEVDTLNQTITIKFNYNKVEEDNYIGLSFY
jgi:hypothetical protein